jgi:hypothetical protein
MKKYLIVLKVKNLLTGEIKLLDWQKYNDEPSADEIIKVKNEYESKFSQKYSEHVEYAKVSCIYE